MGDVVSSLIAPLETALAGVLLANMLEAWLDAEPNVSVATEVFDEPQNHRAASEQTCL